MFIPHKVGLSEKQKILLLTISVIIGISIFFSIKNVYGAQVQDYLTIANANASVENTFVYGDYFYVVNDTDIIKYYLEDGTLTSTYEIIDFMDSVNKVLRKGYEVYIDFTTSGSRYYMCFDLRTFEEMNRTLKSELVIEDINDDIWNYVYYEFDDNGYWLYGFAYTSASGDAFIHSNVFKMSFDEIAPYENFGAVFSTHVNTGNSYGGSAYNVMYIYNTTSDSTTTYTQNCGATSDHMSQFSYSGMIYNVSGSEWIKSALYGETTPPVEYDQNDWAGREDCYNVQNEVVIQDNGRMYTYASFGRYTIRGDLNIELYPEFFGGSYDHAWYWDLDSADDLLLAYSHNWGDTPSKTFSRAYNREGDGFGTWSTFTVNEIPDFGNNINKIGRASFGEYETYTGYDNLYIGYVNQSTDVPIAERVVLASGNDIVSSFDYDDVLDCYIYMATENLVATFTREDDTTLYVLRNLIDRDELASGGYLTPTLQFISANIYTIVGGEKVVNDGWLFMGEVYQIESIVQNMSYYYLELDDGENTIRFYYENSTKSLNVTASDEFVVGLTHAYVETVNATSERYNCEWRFILGKNIVDSPSNITITYYGENIVEDKEVSGTAITGLKIYNLGGFVYYDFGGDGGRTEGGDALELYATDGNQSSYAQAEIVFRKLQHTHLLVEIDMDNDFDTNHLDFPLGCGFVEYGFDYRLDGIWVTGWKAKIYVNDARVGRYGAGVDSSWVDVEIDWYNKANQAGVIKDDNIFAYHYGYDKDADYAPRKSIILWVDLWFNRMNASTVIGGRVNSYEHGMYEAGSTWWFGYGNFRPKIGNATASMFFDDLYDGDGDIISCKPFELIKMWARVEKINSTDGNDDTWRLKNYEILTWKLADDRMEGVDTPVFVETKDPSMPKTGFVSPIISAIQGISTAISKAMFNMVKLLIGAMDSLLVNVLNSPVSMTQMINWIMIQASYVGDWLATVVEYASEVLTIFTSMVTTILRVMSWTISSISWVLVYVVGFPIHFLDMIYAVLTGGTWTMGAFYIDFSSQGDLVTGLMQLAPYGVGFAFTVWLLFGNIEMKGDIDIERMPSRIHQVFRWFKMVYQDIFWIFTTMHNKIIELYNFIRSHIPYIGGSGGREA